MGCRYQGSDDGGILQPEQQLKLLSKIWGRGRDGYVFLPWIVAGDERRRWHEGPAYAWPADRDRVLTTLRAHALDDLYFAPAIFNGTERREDLVDIEGTLWADLDEADPQEFPEALKPTHAWETSPGRYQAIWEMTSPRHGASWPGKENQRLSHAVGADPSGWDSTQLLRVPGGVNNKAHHIKNNGGVAPRGQLVWTNREIHDWDAFDALPQVETARVLDIDVLGEELLDSVDRHDVWGKVRLKVSSHVRDYMRMRDADGHDRSEVAWQIERDLADAGCSLAEIVAVMRPTVWNKFEGRNDELKRLMTEVAKAIAARPNLSGHTGGSDDLLEPAEDDTPKPVLVPFWEDDGYLNQPEPQWLVEGLIPEGGCGFISGIPKSMKSWLALDLSISLTANVEYLERMPTRVCNVLYIQQEDPASLVLQRHIIIARTKAPQHAPGDLLTPSPGALYVVVQSGFIGSDMGWQAWLDEQVLEHEIDLVVMDTLATVSGGADIDSGREVKASLLDPIKVISRRHNCAMLFVHHNTKAGSNSRAGQNMSGSGQIHAWADFGIYAQEKDERSNRLTFSAETKYTGTESMTFEMAGLDEDPQEWRPRYVLKDEDAISTGISVDFSTSGDGPKKGQERNQQRAKEKAERMNECREILSHSPQASPLDISRRLGVSVKTITGYLKTMRAEDTDVADIDDL
jgi:hypothetical protein